MTIKALRLTIGMLLTLGAVATFASPVYADSASPSAYPPDFYDGTVAPGADWVWSGNGPPGSDLGAWFNPSTRESWHPDLNHPDEIRPHWDYRSPNGSFHRWFEDGRLVCS